MCVVLDSGSTSCIPPKCLRIPNMSLLGLILPHPLGSSEHTADRVSCRYRQCCHTQRFPLCRLRRGCRQHGRSDNRPRRRHTGRHSCQGAVMSTFVRAFTSRSQDRPWKMGNRMRLSVVDRCSPISLTASPPRQLSPEKRRLRILKFSGYLDVILQRLQRIGTRFAADAQLDVSKWFSPRLDR